MYHYNHVEKYNHVVHKFILLCSAVNKIYFIFKYNCLLQHVVSQFSWYHVTVPCTVLYLQILTCGFSTLYVPLQFFKYLYILLQNWRSYSVSMPSQPNGFINCESGSGFGCKYPNLQCYKNKNCQLWGRNSV